ncbi:MAG: hypothetical protein ALECFALPRED_010655 [Alectoria fallacina]|uniref:Uncharacterized protein n=1 Tax=Alectoria fallacina TaxID=1903189 RepID=A0A8H3EJ57_9LECA|nr:MAG: hypothetical protein ALECFALPRED_010655 [Alectoria fallacina]
MAHFGPSTTGAEVVGHFKDRVKGKTSKITITHRRSALLVCITVLVTGPSVDGIGAETAMSLAAGSPACILLAGRWLPKIQTVIDHISGAYPDADTRFISLDLKQPRCYSRSRNNYQWKGSNHRHSDQQRGNNGKSFCKDRRWDREPIRIGHFLLTNLIMERLVAGQGARIINVSGSAHRMSDVHLDDWNFEVCRPWCGGTADETFH